MGEGKGNIVLGQNCSRYLRDENDCGNFRARLHRVRISSTRRRRERADIVRRCTVVTLCCPSRDDGRWNEIRRKGRSIVSGTFAIRRKIFIFGDCFEQCERGGEGTVAEREIRKDVRNDENGARKGVVVVPGATLFRNRVRSSAVAVYPGSLPRRTDRAVDSPRPVAVVDRFHKRIYVGSSADDNGTVCNRSRLSGPVRDPREEYYNNNETKCISYSGGRAVPESN